MNRFLAKIKKLITYLKYHKDINSNYGFALKNGYACDDTANWEERTDYYFTDPLD